jgi:hypothetical protein
MHINFSKDSNMKAILIDPYFELIEEMEYSGDWRDINKLLQCDEGLYVENQKYWKFAGYPQPLAGMGLVLGCNDEGDSVSCESTLEQVKAMVAWCPDGTEVEPKFEILFGDDLLEFIGK